MSAVADWRLEEELSQARPTRATLGRLGAFLRPYRGHVAAILALETVWCASYLLGPVLIQRAIDEGLVGGNTRALATLCALFALNVLARHLMVGRELLIITRTGQRVLADLRRAIFEHVQRLSMRFFDRTQHGRIIARADRDVDALERIVTWGPVEMTATVGLLIMGIAKMLHYDARVSAVVFACVPTLFLSSEIFRRAGLRAYRSARRALSELTAHFAETINGMRVIQACVQEGTNRARGESRIEACRESAIRTVRVWSTYHPVIGMHYALAATGILLVGGARVARGEMTVGELIAFLLLLEFVFHPIEEIAELYNDLLSASAATERIAQLLDARPQIVDRPGARDLPHPRGAVALRDVRFAYAPELPRVLHDVSFELPAGRTLALVGETGAGKSSIVALLCRFYEAQEGTVEIDGVDIRDVRLETLRRIVSMIPQDGYLFSGTVLENLRFGRPDASDDEIVAAARALGAHEILASLPEGYATPVGERGGRLSHGQRQAVCYVRALLSDPAILVLDEATSALDAATERTLQEALRRLSQGRTTVIVAHRLSTIRHADEVLVVDGGRIVERGRHEDLVARDGPYRRLYAHAT